MWSWGSEPGSLRPLTWRRGLQSALQLDREGLCGQNAQLPHLKYERARRMVHLSGTEIAVHNFRGPGAVQDAGGAAFSGQ